MAPSASPECRRAEASDEAAKAASTRLSCSTAIRKCLAQERHGLVRAAGDGTQLAEVVQELADVFVIGDALEEHLGALRVVARPAVLVPPLGNERCVEIGLGQDAVVTQSVGELERGGDVLGRSREVLLAAADLGPGVQDPHPQGVGRTVGGGRAAQSLVERGESPSRDCPS